MPYLGGASLAADPRPAEGSPPARRTGSQLLEALDQVQARLPVVAPRARDRSGATSRRSPYVEAICWIGACLADGLQYAHDRDLVHMDIKPSNVLLAGDGQPMLLDFHLARGPIVAGDAATRLDGRYAGIHGPRAGRGDGRRARRTGRSTSPWTAAPTSTRWACCCTRRLGGIRPSRETPGGGSAAPPAAIRGSRWGSPISSTNACGADPRDRYTDAAALAADLRRHLDDLPLRGVANRSPVERLRKWRRRRPYGAAADLVFLVVAAARRYRGVGLLSAAYRQRVDEVEAALASGRASLDGRQSRRGHRALTARPRPRGAPARRRPLSTGA